MSVVAKGKYHEWLEPDNLLRLQAWARDGLTDEQIAINMGINRDTLYRWKRNYPDISDALKKGKEVIDTMVENALLKRALGYDYEEVTEELRYNKDIDDYEMVQTKRIGRHEKPDTTAQIFWLKNRRPDLWRDKKDIDMKADINNPFDDISTDDIKKLIGGDGGASK